MPSSLHALYLHRGLNLSTCPLVLKIKACNLEDQPINIFQQKILESIKFCLETNVAYELFLTFPQKKIYISKKYARKAFKSVFMSIY